MIPDPEGTIYVNESTQATGVRHFDRIEYEDKVKVDVMLYPDTTRISQRVEYNDGDVFFRVIEMPDESVAIGIANMKDADIWTNLRSWLGEPMTVESVETKDNMIHTAAILGFDGVWISGDSSD
jgi:N-dimethylarginine dimethylaminohydrolase